MNTDSFGRILKSTARLEAMAEATHREIAELKHETRDRLNQHSASIRSLNATRNKQRGAAKGLGVLGGIGAAILGWLRYYG